MRLTTTKIHNAPPQKKTVRLFDGCGLYLQIAPTGSRWWRFKYRFAGKEKRISLGVYPNVGLKKARDKRDDMRKLIADGIDPSAACKQEKLMALDAALNTFEAVAREWFEKHSPPASTTIPCPSRPWFAPPNLAAASICVRGATPVSGLVAVPSRRVLTLNSRTFAFMIKTD